jgi:choline dehydrogenase
MVYIRGNRGDYDHWRDLGNGGWGYEDVLPYFVRMECNQRIQDAYHGSAGPISVSDHCERNPLSSIYVEAAQEIGISLNSDFNGAVQEGCGYYQMTCREREVQCGGWLPNPDFGAAEPQSRHPCACHSGADRG